MFLHRDPLGGHVRQVRLQWLPVLSIIEQNINRVLRSQEQQAFAHRVLADAVHVAQHAGWNPMSDLGRTTLPRDMRDHPT